MAQEMVCTRCGMRAKPYVETPGSFAIELILWFFVCLPGLIYSIWRLASKYGICPYCQARELVPAGTPAANAIEAQYRK